MTGPYPPPTIPGLTFLARLGSGGYADVYCYQQALPRRRVAVKVLRDAGLSPAAVDAVTAEANALGRLEHPHIVGVLAAGATADGRPYLVMPLLDGASLAERAGSSGGLPVAEVLHVGVAVCGAVETAHRAGLLHRDIKPSNLLTTRYGTPALADFGIAAAVTEADDDAGLSVPWSAPEVLGGREPASVASDVYSLGATLWTLLVGRAPFAGPDARGADAAMVLRIRDLPAPPTGRPDVPAALESVLARAMAKSSRDRFGSALELAHALQGVEAALGLPVSRPTVAAPEAATERVETPVPRGEPGRAARPRARRPALLAAAIAALVALAALAWWARPWGATAPGEPSAGAPAASIEADRNADRVTFRWRVAGGRTGDTYLVRVGDRVVPVDAASLEIAGRGPICVSVRVVRDGRPVGDFSERRCA